MARFVLMVCQPLETLGGIGSAESDQAPVTEANVVIAALCIGVAMGDPTIAIVARIRALSSRFRGDTIAYRGTTFAVCSLALAHPALATPFVVIPVSATLQSFDMNLARAAASLGASPLEAFRRVILPLILPGLASGALFAFATSFDEVIIVLFLAGPEQRTLPREMFSGIRENISPTITAAAVILTTASVIMLATMEGLRRRNERLKRNNG